MDDKNPEQNAVLITQLNQMGAEVVVSQSTTDALAKFESTRFDRVITDMGRLEDGVWKGTAGIDLIKQVRAVDKSVPIIVSCSKKAVQNYGEAARAAGANEVTSSPAAILRALNLDR